MQDTQKAKEQRDLSKNVPNAGESDRRDPDGSTVDQPVDVAKKRNPRGRGKTSSRSGQRIREGEPLTSAGVEQGQSQSEVPEQRRQDDSSFGSE